MNISFAGKPSTIQLEPRGQFNGAVFKNPEEGSTGRINLLA